jgi:hypothetical protein
VRVAVEGFGPLPPAGAPALASTCFMLPAPLVAMSAGSVRSPPDERLVPDARAKVLARSNRRFLDGADAIMVRNVGRGRLAHFGTFLPVTPGPWLGGGTTRVTVDQGRFLLRLTRETGILTMHLTTTVSTKGQAILPNLKPLTADFAPTRPEDVFGCLPYRGKPKSIEEMDAGIAQEVKRRHGRDRH